MQRYRVNSCNETFDLRHDVDSCRCLHRRPEVRHDRIVDPCRRVQPRSKNCKHVRGREREMRLTNTFHVVPESHLRSDSIETAYSMNWESYCFESCLAIHAVDRKCMPLNLWYYLRVVVSPCTCCLMLERSIQNKKQNKNVHCK